MVALAAPKHAGNWAFASILRRGIGDLLRPSKATVPGLDALRSLAILLVFSDHAYAFFLDATKQSLSISQFPLIHFGWTGVDLFFVLSGFLIGKQLWLELHNTPSIRIGRFLVRRGMRIWPLYFAFIATMICLRNPVSWKSFWPDIFFITNYIPGQIAGGWSLSTEEQFYLVVPVGLLIARRVMDIRWFWPAPLALLILMPCMRALALAGHPHLNHGDAALFYVTYTPFHTHADGLIVGLLIAWASVFRPELTAPMRQPKYLLAPLALVTIGLTLRWADKDLFAFTALGLIYGGVTLLVLRDDSALTAFTRLRVFHIGSRLSYGIYLNHFVVLAFLMKRNTTPPAMFDPTTFGFLESYFVALTLSVLVAIATFVLIESPFLQLRDAWMHGSARGPKNERRTSSE